MHPEIENHMRELAREFVLGEVGERGNYCRASESGRISFDDIYFLGVVDGAQTFSWDIISQIGDTDFGNIDDSNRLIHMINDRAIKLTSEFYRCSAPATQERLDSIHVKVDGSG